ncbi:MAG: bifunctional phosphopantothenoylcysteine decarboxylase/phosphopantothenate--cysteine ligase CoaBC [Saprospiraceae bacterium]|nr:bifunctional phosphopantothenoylcysteine decarboxylase/phosphopantothenate--cysteine ligase CoaBC [Saprospiraceae bacterium]
MENKRIILAVSGSIAAYKSAFLTRLLVKAGAEVQILMTESATRFITPLTLGTLSKRPVFTEIISENAWNNHVELGLWADAMIVAPATATTLAKMAHGLCDNIITATYLSARCPVFVAPAMDLDMWVHGANTRNLDLLRGDKVSIIPVGHGELASGLVGDGRMAEPEDIVAFVADFLKKQEAENLKKRDLTGKKIMVTAGPTYEALDPVRFIGNRSSGKMGFSIVKELAARGADVHLIVGPAKIPTDLPPSVSVTKIESAQQMYNAATQLFSQCDAAILAAAVADYRPKEVSDVKIKKKDSEMSLELEKTPDIAAALGQLKQTHQRIIGFALETNNEFENAVGKLKRKNFDAIVLNSLRDAGAGFSGDTNKISIIFDEKTVQNFDLKPKDDVANDIVAALKSLLVT